MKFLIEYLYLEDARKYQAVLESGIIADPLKLLWTNNSQEYCYEWTEQERPFNILLSSQYILILYYEDSQYFSHPTNLVLHNLKKEIIKIIETPILKSKETKQYKAKSKMAGMGKIVEYENKKYLEMSIEPYLSYYCGNEDYYYEIQLLDLETFEFHGLCKAFIL